MHHAEYRDRRLVEVYDAECPWSSDDDYFVSVIGPPGARVLDLGCGSGRLTLGLARAGHTVTGVDPARASLDAARAKPGAEAVTWIEGTSSSLPAAAFDAAVMTSHVAQLLVDDREWARTLADLRTSLVPGGTLAFDSRDPDDRRWELWNPVASHRRIVLEDGRVIDAWTEVTAIDAATTTVSFCHHYVFPDGEELVSTAALRFRHEAELRTAVEEAGFTVEHVYGGWQREPVGAPAGELLVIARR